MNQASVSYASSIGSVSVMNRPGANSEHVLEEMEDEVTSKEDDHHHDGGNKEQVWTALSAMYGTALIIVLGIALPIGSQLSNINMKSPRVPYDEFHGIQSAAYGVAIIFLLYVYIYRRLQKRLWPNEIEEGEPESNSRARKKRKAVVIEETGSFYLRLGALVFGLGGIILTVLEVAWISQGTGVCEWPSVLTYYVMQGIFFFLQMYFIFENTELCITRFRPLLQFGLMHVAATNILTWLWTLKDESFLEMAELYLHEQEHHKSGGENTHLINPGNHSNFRAGVIENHEESSSCEWQDIEGYKFFAQCTGGNSTFGPLLVTMIPYLFPCIIEFALIGGSLTFLLWTRHGKPRYVSSSQAQREQSALLDMKEAFSGTTKGLFLGLIFMAATVVCLILFTALLSEMESAVLRVAHLNEGTLHVVTLIASIIAWVLMAPLAKMKHGDSSSLDATLLYLALFGQLFFYTLSFVAAVYTEDDLRSFNLANYGVGFIQAIVQAMFIFDITGRRCATENDFQRKPGRELVTFLLVTNFALWFVNVFQNQKADYNPVQSEFFGAATWILLTRLCQPLAIFFRFHSTVCLVDIWLETYENHHHKQHHH